jgi:hypothetical protein
LHLWQPISNRPQQKLAPKIAQNVRTMYAVGFRDARATLLRLPTDATKLEIIFSALAHDFCVFVTIYDVNMKIKKYECL